MWLMITGLLLLVLKATMSLTVNNKRVVCSLSKGWEYLTSDNVERISLTHFINYSIHKFGRQTFAKQNHYLEINNFLNQRWLKTYIKHCN